MNVAIRSFFVALTLLYPVMVYWGISTGKTPVLLLVLFGLVLARLWLANSRLERLCLLVLMAVISAIIQLAGVENGLLFYPVAINMLLLVVFASSLINGMPIIERLARIREADLPQQAIIYTRRVTQVWCGFFIANASISLFTILSANQHLWFIYNGVIAYLLLGLMFVGEWLIRQRVRARAS